MAFGAERERDEALLRSDPLRGDHASLGLVAAPAGIHGPAPHGAPLVEYATE